MGLNHERKKDFDYFKKHQAEIFGHLKCTSEISPDGPEVLIVGGTHGNEPSGVKALLRFHQLLSADNSLLKQGRVHFLLGNPAAYLQNKRYVDYDLNRSFTDKDMSHLEAARAAEIDRFFNRGASFAMVLDIHSLSKGHYQMLVYNSKGLSGQLLAREISPIMTHLAYHEEHINGLLIDRCSKWGHPGVAIECGNHYHADSEQVAFYHIYRLLLHYGMVDKHAEWGELENLIHRQQEVIQYETLQAIIPNDKFAFVKKDVTTGTTFVKGEVYARGGGKEFVAPADCFLVMPPEDVEADDHDAGFLCLKHTL